jgi:hypothetical protein
MKILNAENLTRETKNHNPASRTGKYPHESRVGWTQAQRCHAILQPGLDGVYCAKVYLEDLHPIAIQATLSPESDKLFIDVSSLEPPHWRRAIACSRIVERQCWESHFRGNLAIGRSRFYQVGVLILQVKPPVLRLYLKPMHLHEVWRTAQQRNSNSPHPTTHSRFGLQNHGRTGSGANGKKALVELEAAR